MFAETLQCFHSAEKCRSWPNSQTFFLRRRIRWHQRWRADKTQKLSHATFIIRKERQTITPETPWHDLFETTDRLPSTPEMPQLSSNKNLRLLRNQATFIQVVVWHRRIGRNSVLRHCRRLKRRRHRSDITRRKRRYRKTRRRHARKVSIYGINLNCKLAWC